MLVTNVVLIDRLNSNSEYKKLLRNNIFYF